MSSLQVGGGGGGGGGIRGQSCKQAVVSNVAPKHLLNTTIKFHLFLR